jgi:glycosyltransferase WbpL
MVLFKYLSLFLFIAFISSFITDFIRRFSIKNKLFDIPNDRSSHDFPKPKGGGISIVFILLGTIATLSYFKMIDSGISMSMLTGLSIVAVTGLVDDYKNLPISIRVISYVAASVLSLYLIGGVSYLSFSNTSFNLGHFGFFLGVLFVVWLTNLYNFMDGADGFAAIQTLCVALFCGSLLYLSDNISFAIILLCLVSSTTGFLYWNWAPAKIFMGDVGSCTIGFLFGLLSIYTEKTGIISISVWLILLAPFIGDATFTLFRRIINKEKWYKAHNSHAYQKLYQLGMTHRELAMGLLAINIIIWPFAYFAYSYKSLEFAMVILSYSLIAGVWLAVQNKCNKVKKGLS